MQTQSFTLVQTTADQQTLVPSSQNKNPLTLKRYISPEEIRENLPTGKTGVGFLFHATDWQTLSFSLHNVKERSPEFEQELWGTSPVITSPIYFGKQVIGANIACPVPLELWLGSPRGIKKFREKQLFPALDLAKKAGLNMVAMGASTPYTCNYGLLPRPNPQPYITTGHAATAAMLKEWTLHCCNETALNFSDAKIALFGAAGKLGSIVAKYLCYKDSPKEIILIDLPDKLNLLKTQATDLAATQLTKHCAISVHTFSPHAALPKFDGAILTSCTSTPYLTLSDLKQARFWIDDSHPRAASSQVEMAAKPYTLYIECFARGPLGLNTDYPFRLPSQRDCYTCFAEGYVA